MGLTGHSLCPFDPRFAGVMATTLVGLGSGVFGVAAVLLTALAFPMSEEDVRNSRVWGDV